jgi:hypothetical protein
VLAAVTYGLVIVVTILSVMAYHRFWPGANATELELQKMSARIMVGSVWVPVYPDAMLHDMTSSTHGDLTEGVLLFNSPDAPSKVQMFYRLKFKKAGFDVTFSDDKIQAVSRKGKSTATVIVSPAEAGSEIQVTTKAVADPKP